MIPATPTPSTTPLDTLFIRALTTATPPLREQALNEISKQIAITSLYPSTTIETLHSIEVSMNTAIENIFSYEPTAFWTPQVCAMFTMCIAVDFYLATLFSLGVGKDSNWRVGITIPMGGASTLGICLAAFTKFFTWWKESEKSDTLLKIQETWGNIFSNPQEKAFLVKLLSHCWISKRLDGSAKGIQTVLKKAFSLAKNMEELLRRLDRLAPKY